MPRPGTRSLDELLRPELVILDLVAESTRAVYAAVARRLVQLGRLAAEAEPEVVSGLQAREKLGGIALGRGVVVPHATVAGLDRPRVAMVRCRSAPPLPTPDGAPADLFFVLVGPRDDPRAHLQALARLAVLLRDDAGLAALRAAPTPDEVLRAARALEGRHPATPKEPAGGQRGLFIVLNETGRLHDVIEGLANIGVSGATVVESRGMANIIAQDIPIFAGFRNLLGGAKPFNYTIFSVVPDAELARSAVAMLRDLLSDLPGTPGIVFTVPVDEFQRLTPAPAAAAKAP